MSGQQQQQQQIDSDGSQIIDVGIFGSKKSSTGNASIVSGNTTATSQSIPFLHPYGGGPTTSVHQTLGSPRLPNPPSLIHHRHMRFLIMDAPSETNLQLYIKEMERYSVSDIVRVCDASYSREAVERHGIKLHELSFPDGEAPPENIINYWLSLVEARFGHGKNEEDRDGDETPAVTIAIHCVAGLGRAPVLVAIALIESGMSAFDAISFIRERRRGAINTRQLKFLETYRSRARSSQTKCCIM